jgi:hypothetical protein
MTTIMDALIRHHNKHSSTPGTDTSAHTDPAPDFPRSPSDSDDAACTPVMFNLDRSSPTNLAHDFHHLSSNPDDAASIPAMFNPNEIPFPSSPPLSNLPPDISLLPLHMDDDGVAPAPAVSTPGTSTLDPSSPLLSSSSGLHSDPGAPMTGSARRPMQEFPPRLWSSVAVTKPLSGGVAQLKPDSVLVRRPADGATQTLEWTDVLMTAEVTSRKETLDLIVQIECKMLAMFDTQPNRAFSYSLSFHAGQYRLYMYDCAGGVYTHPYDLHESPLPLLCILCMANFTPTSWLGMDDTFNCGTQYFVITKCFSSSVIRGRATHICFVAKSVLAGSDPKDIFMIKNLWVNVECQLSEEQIFEALKDVDCVPKVEKAWTVQQDGQDDSTSLHHPKAFMSHFK